MTDFPAFAWLSAKDYRNVMHRSAFCQFESREVAPVNRSAAAHTVQSLTAAPTNLLDNPRIGERLDEFEPREVRRLLVGHYEMRYELQESNIYILRIWHTRENR